MKPKEFWAQGKLHREDGPAVEWSSKNGLCRREYWLQGEMHRKDGPAFELIKTDSGTEKYLAEEWLVENKRHRMDGPAIHCSGKIIPPEPWPADLLWDQTPVQWRRFPRIPRGSLTNLLSRCWAGYGLSSRGDFGIEMGQLTTELDRFGVKWCLRHYGRIEKLFLENIFDKTKNGPCCETLNLLDYLGSYTPETKLIELYFPTILRCSRFLDDRLPCRADPSVMTLAVMVFVHEMGHAIDHARAHRNKTPFPTTPKQDEASAQRFTWNVIQKHAPRARMVFEELEKHQPAIYRNWR